MGLVHAMRSNGPLPQVPIKNLKFKMALKLQGIVILDTTYTDVSPC